MSRVLLSLAVVALSSLTGCAHASLSRAALDDTKAVAVLARLEDDAGPRVTVFRDSDAWKAELSKRSIDAKEGDRRLGNVLAQGSFEKEKDGSRKLVAHTLTRFEFADSLRSTVLDLLPREHPWTVAASPSDVARVLESFLVQEIPSTRPEYSRLKELGVDTVVEISIEEFGLHATGGRAGVYVVGTARMFRVDGGELYHRHFFSDELSAGLPGVDPFAVAKNAQLYVDHMKPIIGAIAQQVAEDLTVGERRPVSRSERPDVVVPRRTGDAPAQPASDDSL